MESRVLESRCSGLALGVLITVYYNCSCTVQHGVRALEFKFRDLLFSAAMSGESSKSTVCFLISKVRQKYYKTVQFFFSKLNKVKIHNSSKKPSESQSWPCYSAGVLQPTGWAISLCSPRKWAHNEETLAGIEMEFSLLKKNCIVFQYNAIIILARSFNRS